MSERLEMGHPGERVRPWWYWILHPADLLPPLPPVESPAWREFTLLALLLLAVFLACYQPIWDPDTYWHLAIGREIWQTLHLVQTETFSFSAHGVPWEDTEWLFHVLAYPLWKAFGYTGLSVFTALMGALVIAVLYRSVRLTGGNAMTLCFYVLVLMGAYQSRIRFRPDLFSLLFLAILVEGLLRWEPRPPSAGRFWIFSAVLFWIWAQFHGGWSYGLALLGACIAGMALDSFRDRTFSFRYMVNLGLTGLASAAVIFVNPYGWKIPWFPVKSLLGFADPQLVQIVEWDRTPWQGAFAVFLSVCLVLGLFVLLRWKRVRWKDFLWALSQIFLGFYWVRYVAYTVVAIVPFSTAPFKPFLKKRRLRSLAWGASYGCVIVACAYYATTLKTAYNLTEKYPVQEVRFLREHQIAGNIFNVYTAGGYLDWYAYPLDRIFMDGRYYPFMNVLRDYYQSHATMAKYRKFLARYPFDIVLYPFPEYRMRWKNPEGRSILRGPTPLLYPEKKWALVYFGNYGEVLLKREPKYAKIIDKYEYRVLRPDDLKYEVKQAEDHPGERAELIREIERKLTSDPYTRYRGKFEKALATLENVHGK